MKRIGRVLFAALVILLLTVFLYSAWNIYSIWHEYKKAERHYDSLSETVVAASVPRPSASPAVVAPPEKEEAPAPRWSEFSPVSVDFDELTALCADMVGWLYLPDTVINYPVVQGTDNDYYLNRFYDGKPNVGGTLFVDYVCPGDFSGANTIIYGHNMKNGSMEESRVFHRLRLRPRRHDLHRRFPLRHGVWRVSGRDPFPFVLCLPRDRHDRGSDPDPVHLLHFWCGYALCPCRQADGDRLTRFPSPVRIRTQKNPGCRCSPGFVMSNCLFSWRPGPELLLSALPRPRPCRDSASARRQDPNRPAS